VCKEGTEECVSEIFVPGTEPGMRPAEKETAAPRFRQPVEGLALAADPRIPDGLEVFRFTIDGAEQAEEILWTVDGKTFRTRAPFYDWNVRRGSHAVSAQVKRSGAQAVSLTPVRFVVR
ncbi:MAG: penicillin-binding protein 1C, partial [Thermodesulfobacteriota bacterium]